MRRRLAGAAVFAGLILVTVPPTVSAECFGFPVRAGERLDAGYAFTATVTDASANVDPPKPDNAAFDWHVELEVEQRYRGDVPDQLVYNGWDVGCHELVGNHLQTGDRIFILSQDLHLDWNPGDPFDGDVVVWKWTGDGWAFYSKVMDYGSDRQFYPAAVRRATTTAAILKLVAEAAPNTDAAQVGIATGPERDAPAGLTILALAFTAGFVLAWRRASRRRLG